MRRFTTVKSQVADAIDRHRAAGREFVAGGVGSFVRQEGDGEPVVLMQGIPVSSFLYTVVPAKHFLQEDQAEAVAEATAKLASRS